MLEIYIYIDYSDTDFDSVKKTKTIVNKRRKLKIFPVFKKIDTCAAEFPTQTSYLYSCYFSICV